MYTLSVRWNLVFNLNILRSLLQCISFKIKSNMEKFHLQGKSRWREKASLSSCRTGGHLWVASRGFLKDLPYLVFVWNPNLLEPPPISSEKWSPIHWSDKENPLEHSRNCLCFWKIQDVINWKHIRTIRRASRRRTSHLGYDENIDEWKLDWENPPAAFPSTTLAAVCQQINYHIS